MYCLPKAKRIGTLIFGAATGLIMSVSQATPVQAALKTSSFQWNGMGLGNTSYQFNGSFTYDDALPTATITGSTASGFTDFVVNSLSLNGSSVAAFTPKQVVSAGSVVNTCAGLCSVPNDITFFTMTQTFAASPQAFGIETASTGFDFLELMGVYYLAIGGGEFVGSAESITGLVVPPANAVPGPLPIVGASMAWGLSRRLRKRIKHSPLQTPSNSIS